MAIDEKKMVFAVAPPNPPHEDAPIVLLGIPAGAWEHMKDGKTHSFDLTKVGVPVKLMLYGAKDHTEAMSFIKAQLSGVPIIDERESTDFSIQPKTGRK
jgi:hypothetical protein